MGFSASSEIISNIKRDLSLDEKTYSAIRIWENEFAPLMNYAELSGIHNGKLIIEVLSSVHFNDLRMKADDIIKKMNQYFGNEKVVKGIKINIKR